MTMIWGIDSASLCTGITAGTGEIMPAVGVWHFEHCGTDLGQLLEDYDRQLTNLADRMPPDVIVYEAPIHRPGDKLLKIRKLYSMGAYLELFGRRRGAKVEEATVQRVKKGLTGNHAASKDDMVEICRRLGIRLPVGEPAKDAADSFGCWYIGLQDHGPPHLTKWDQAIHSRRGFLV